MEMRTAIEVSDLSYRYHDGTEALRGVGFAVAEGECVGLLGPNGSGKSTLLLHLNGLLPEKPATNGQVRIFDRPVQAGTLEQVRRDVGLLFQDPDDQLFCATVEEDVAFGPRQSGLGADALSRRVETALTQVGLAGFASPACWPVNPPCSFWMNPPATWIRVDAASSRRCCGKSTPRS